MIDLVLGCWLRLTADSLAERFLVFNCFSAAHALIEMQWLDLLSQWGVELRVIALWGNVGKNIKEINCHINVELWNSEAICGQYDEIE